MLKLKYRPSSTTKGSAMPTFIWWVIAYCVAMAVVGRLIHYRQMRICACQIDDECAHFFTMIAGYPLWWLVGPAVLTAVVRERFDDNGNQRLINKLNRADLKRQIAATEAETRRLKHDDPLQGQSFLRPPSSS